MVMPRGRGRPGLVALAAAAALCWLTPVARADTIAIVSEGAVSQATLDGPDEFAELTDGASGVAYDRDGRLWFSRPGEQEFGSCSIAPADGVGFFFSPGRIQAQMRRRNIFNMHCTLVKDPRGGLLIEGSNQTLGSTSVWHLDTANGTVSLVSWGYSPAPSADGTRLAVVKHVYRRGGGADERLALGTLGLPGTVRPAYWAKSGWSSPSFGPDGRLAAVRWGKHGSRLLVGAGGPPWRVVWSPGRAWSIGPTAWSSTGDLFVLAGRPNDDGGRLFRFVSGAGAPLLYTTGISDFALGPDQTSPPVSPPTT